MTRANKMTTQAKIIFSICIMIFSFSIKAFEDDLPITRDTRIKTYIYNPNEVYMLLLHYGFQSHIEFAQGESVDTISMGETYAWKITPMGNRLFLRPLEKNVKTNMTIITNRRSYQFDLVSKELEEGEEEDLVYQIKFFYPKKNYK